MAKGGFSRKIRSLSIKSLLFISLIMLLLTCPETSAIQVCTYTIVHQDFGYWSKYSSGSCLSCFWNFQTQTCEPAWWLEHIQYSVDDSCDKPVIKTFSDYLCGKTYFDYCGRCPIPFERSPRNVVGYAGWNCSGTYSTYAWLFDYDWDNVPDALDANGAPICLATGVTRPCYTGPTGTAGIGVCQKGTQTFTINIGWGACLGEVLPQTELCDTKDNNCNGQVDEGCNIILPPPDSDLGGNLICK